MNKVLESSANKDNLSLTIRGALIAIAPIIIFILGKLGFEVAQTDAANFVAEVASAIAIIVTAYGAIRKAVIAGAESIDEVGKEAE